MIHLARGLDHREIVPYSAVWVVTPIGGSFDPSVLFFKKILSSPVKRGTKSNGWFPNVWVVTPTRGSFDPSSTTRVIWIFNQ